MRGGWKFFAILTIGAVACGGIVGLTTLNGGAGALDGQAGALEQVRISDRRLLVYEASGCSQCVRFREDLGARYVKTKYQERAPLTYMHTSRQGDGRFSLQRPVSTAPTFVVVDAHGREVGRLVGSPRNSAHLFDFIDQAL